MNFNSIKKGLLVLVVIPFLVIHASPDEVSRGSGGGREARGEEGYPRRNYDYSNNRSYSQGFERGANMRQWQGGYGIDNININSQYPYGYPSQNPYYAPGYYYPQQPR